MTDVWQRYVTKVTKRTLIEHLLCILSAEVLGIQKGARRMEVSVFQLGSNWGLDSQMND